MTGNVHVVCTSCNGVKSDLSIEELAVGLGGPEWQAWAVARQLQEAA